MELKSRFKTKCFLYIKHMRVDTQIPRCIHQIWMQGKDCIPTRLQEARATWKDLHPLYTVKVWDEPQLEQLVHDTYWTVLISKCTTLIQRADIYRCAVLESEGGVYVDMDMYAIKSIEPLLQELDTQPQELALGKTSFFGSPLHSLLAVNNAWISAKPNSTFWKTVYFPLVLGNLHQFTLLDMISPLYHVLKTAGPGAWTRLSTDSRIKLVPKEFFYSLKKVKQSTLTAEDKELLRPLSYAYHRQDSSWMKSWETLLISMFLGNAWKYTAVSVFLLFLVYTIQKSLT
jgi:hypothetical protein